MTTGAGGTYEMLWDCAYCGARKLLGLTHRHCPQCGAAQDPTRRYFPQPGEEIAVADHVFVGVDRVCPACRNPNAAASQHCASCGAGLDSAAAVELKHDGLEHEGTPDAGAGSAPRPPRRPPQGLVDRERSGRGRPGCWNLRTKILLVTAVVMILTVLFWKRDVELEVTGRSWQRTIAVEELGPERAATWCDSVPAGAYRISRSEKVRSHRRIPDGEECSTVRRDHGDGTFGTEQVCRTRYREEPVYDDYCSFVIDRWGELREEVAEGRDDAPRWPVVRLERPGTCRGCQREGSRRERYRIELRAGDEEHACTVPLDRWTRASPGQRWRAREGVLTSRLDCDALEPVAPAAP